MIFDVYQFLYSDVSARQDITASTARKSLQFATLKIPTSYAATAYAWASLEHRSVTLAFAIKYGIMNRSTSSKVPFFNRLFSQGWQSEGTNPACIKDVDECAGNHRPCSVNPWVACRNAPGTFFCDSCPRGYTGNGYYCADIDECQVNNGGCSTSPLVQCINTMVTRRI